MHARINDADHRVVELPEMCWHRQGADVTCLLGDVGTWQLSTVLNITYMHIPPESIRKQTTALKEGSREHGSEEEAGTLAAMNARQRLRCSSGGVLADSRGMRRAVATGSSASPAADRRTSLTSSGRNPCTLPDGAHQCCPHFCQCTLAVQCCVR